MKEQIGLKEFLETELEIYGDPFDGTWSDIYNEICELQQKLSEKQEMLKKLEEEQVIFNAVSRAWKFADEYKKNLP